MWQVLMILRVYSKLKDIIQCYKLMYKNFDINFANKLMDVFDLGQNKRIGRLSKGQTDNI